MSSPSPDGHPADADSTEPVPEPWRDASEVGLATARGAWTEAARSVLLTTAGRYRALVSLTELAAAVQDDTRIRTSLPPHRWVGDVLEGVARECESRGEPLLTSLCVNVQRSVGAAYADAVEQVRGTRPTDPDEHAAQERLDCYRHWDAVGLPSDGGTPLRTAHFKPARTTPVRRAARPAAPRPAATRAAPPRTAAAAVAAPTPKPVALCPRCFTQVPASGVCDYCD